MTYGDGVSNVNIKQLVNFHKTTGTLATVTGILPNTKFGLLSVKNGLVTEFAKNLAMTHPVGLMAVFLF